MANVRVAWTLPTTRQSGKPLSPADIAGVELAQSADGGANFGVIDTLPPTTTSTLVNELEPGDWYFRGVVIDTAGRRSSPVVKSISIADTTPPGELSLTLTLE
jgi:hypothetical protein